MTFERSLSASFSSSPTVEHKRRRGLLPESFGFPAMPLVVSSVIDLTLRPVSCSYQSFAMMPVCDGHAPVMNTAWPGAVNVGT